MTDETVKTVSPADGRKSTNEEVRNHLGGDFCVGGQRSGGMLMLRQKGPMVKLNKAAMKTLKTEHVIMGNGFLVPQDEYKPDGA